MLYLPQHLDISFELEVSYKQLSSPAKAAALHVSNTVASYTVYKVNKYSLYAHQCTVVDISLICLTDLELDLQN